MPPGPLSGWNSTPIDLDARLGFCRDLLDIPRYAAVRRINEVVKRARTVKVHALVCSTIRKMMPSMWGADKKQREIVENLDVVFTAVSMEHGIPPGDFPDVEVGPKPRNMHSTPYVQVKRLHAPRNVSHNRAILDIDMGFRSRRDRIHRKSFDIFDRFIHIF